MYLTGYYAKGGEGDRKIWERTLLNKERGLIRNLILLPEQIFGCFFSV